jgi:hypothetical protein
MVYPVPLSLSASALSLPLCSSQIHFFSLRLQDEVELNPSMETENLLSILLAFLALLKTTQAATTENLLHPRSPASEDLMKVLVARRLAD